MFQSGGPYWEVPKGRKDGRISRATETTLLPKPTFNISQLQQSFQQRGLSADDLVALLGQHYITINAPKFCRINFLNGLPTYNFRTIFSLYFC